uniref:hypothetical protein n=1 Tax=Ornithobacterium rhinotracheale TaxID=28251 RepID=UPI0039A4B0C7
MKKILLTLACSSLVYTQAQEKTQDTSLENLAKIGIFIDHIQLGYELPLGQKYLLNLAVGAGGANIIEHNSFEYHLGNNYYGLYGKIQAKYYFNRERRVAKGRSLINNAGSFLGLQTKWNNNGNKEYTNPTWLTDVHFGQQVPLGQKFLFNYQVGLGYGRDLETTEHLVYPAFSFNFSYVIK